LWGTRKTGATDWTTNPEMTGHDLQASDHAAVFIDLALSPRSTRRADRL